MSASDLARRWAALVADGRGRWLPGMHTARGLCVVMVGLSSDRMVLQDGYGIDDDDVPDWEHHGTTGGLLALVRLAWGDPGLHARLQVNGWSVSTKFHSWSPWDPKYPHVAMGKLRSGIPTEAECLLAALEAAPKGAK